MIYLRRKVLKTFKQVQVWNPCCLLKDPGNWKTMEWQLKRRGVLNPLKTRRYKTEVVTLTNYLQKQVACWNGKWIYSVVLASFEVGLEERRKVLTIICSEKKIDCWNGNFETVLFLFLQKGMCAYIHWLHDIKWVHSLKSKQVPMRPYRHRTTFFLTSNM